MYRPPGPYADFLKEFADFVTDLLVHADKALIVGVFGIVFIDLLNSVGVKQNINKPTHRFNHTLDLVLSHDIDLSDIEILPQSDDVSDHYLVSYKMHIGTEGSIAPRY